MVRLASAIVLGMAFMSSCLAAQSAPPAAACQGASCGSTAADASKARTVSARATDADKASGIEPAGPALALAALGAVAFLAHRRRSY